MFRTAVFSLVSGFADAHSWADSVGGGSYRGSQGGNDLIKQRYFCPLSSVDACQPPASTGVVLTAENMRPCRTDFSTPQSGSAVAGKSMYVHWAGNGHTGSKGAGTCVSIYIAPYALDPDMRSFRQLASCLPFSHDGDATDATVMIPADLASGKYTVFWMWDFAPFWFSSCSDINVSGSAGTVPPNTPRPTVTSQAPSPAQSVATSTAGVVTTTSLRPSSSGAASAVSDCKSFDRPNAACQSQYGASSYCVSWVMDKCGRSACMGAPALDDSKC